jgi:hypothetical protein
MVTNHQNNNFERGLPVYVYLKFAYQTINFTIVLFRNSSMMQMVQDIREKINEKFGLEENEYELVETGQIMPRGVPAEEASPLAIEDQTIRERFYDQNHISFYIRLFPPLTFEAAMQRGRSSQSVPIPNTEDEDPPICVICQETNPILTTYFGCCHPVCNDCCNGCIQAEINQCAICRHYRIES